MKNWMFIVSDVFSMCLCSMIVVKYLTIFNTKQRFGWKAKSILKLLYVILGVLVNYFPMHKAIYLVLMFLILLGYSYLVEMKILTRIFSIVILNVLLIVSEILFTLLIGAIVKRSPEELVSSIMIYIQIAVISKLFLYAFVRIVLLKKKFNSYSLPNVVIVAFIILPLTSFATLYFLTEYSFNARVQSTIILIFALVLLLIFSNILIFYIFEYISRVKDKEKTTESKATQLEYERQYYCDLYQKQSVSDKTTHDLKNKFYAISTLIDEDVEAAKRIIADINSRLVEVNAIKVTGNIGVDSLLNAKIAEAKEKGITVNVTSWLGNATTIDALDLCVILGNLVDNGIEASEKLPENAQKHIDIAFKQDANYYNISVINNFEVEKERVDRTSKRDKRHHGFGIENIQEVVKKYNGYMKSTQSDGKFVVNIALEE